MKKIIALVFSVLLWQHCFCWGFFAHKKINNYAVFLLPPEMMVLYKPHADFLTEHSIDPDKRRYAVPWEGPRHYIDLDHYGQYPFDSLPRKWKDAVAKYSEDTLNAHGTVPWWVQTMLHRLTDAFRQKNQAMILKLSAEIGHYIADSHVPLHTHSNYNGQYTDQKGIHGFWESRIPELLADKDPITIGWDFFIGKAEYIRNPADFIWARILESAAAADSVLKFEKELTRSFPSDQKFSFEDRNGITVRQYSASFSRAYNEKLKGMVERRMRQSIFATASFWYTAWINAGQPDLAKLTNKEFSAEELKEFESLNNAWKTGVIKGREENLIP